MLVLESYFQHQQLYYSTRFLVLFSKKKKKSLLVTGCGTTCSQKDEIHLIVLSLVQQRGGGEPQECVGRGQSNSRVCVCFRKNTIPFVKRLFFYTVKHELGLTAVSKVYLSVPHD